MRGGVGGVSDTNPCTNPSTDAHADPGTSPGTHSNPYPVACGLFHRRSLRRRGGADGWKLLEGYMGTKNIPGCGDSGAFSYESWSC